MYILNYLDRQHIAKLANIEKDLSPSAIQYQTESRH